MRANPSSLAARRQRLAACWAHGRPAVMGVLNCTPDSFSDGGRYFSQQAAFDHAVKMLAGGADIIDVGGESTRPGAPPVPAAEEIHRVLPVIAELRRRHPDAVLSVDTSKAAVADEALAAGADLINDVTAGRDPAMLRLAADRSAGLILMHMRGTPRTMQSETAYRHVVAEVHAGLSERARSALDAGLPPELVWLDPGIGFGKDDAGNLALLAALPDLASLGHPVVVGPSRKSFIGRLTGAGVEDRLPGTLAALQPALACPRAVVRVHEPSAAVQYLQMAMLIASAR